MSALLFPRGASITGLGFALINRTNGNAVTTGTCAGYVTLDGGTQAPMAANPTHKGNGGWSFNLSSSERNAKITSCLFVHSDGVIHNINIISDDQLGPGSVEVIINYNSVAGNAQFWITPTSSSTVIASGELDINGDVTVYLDPGSYYVYGQKVGVNFANPRLITVV